MFPIIFLMRRGKYKVENITKHKVHYVNILRS